MQGSFQIAIKSRVFSQTCLLIDLLTRELFVRKYAMYPEGVQPIKGNNCALIPMMGQTVRELFLKLHGPTIFANR